MSHPVYGKCPAVRNVSEWEADCFSLVTRWDEAIRHICLIIVHWNMGPESTSWFLGAAIFVLQYTPEAPALGNA